MIQRLKEIFTKKKTDKEKAMFTDYDNISKVKKYITHSMPLITGHDHEITEDGVKLIYEIVQTFEKNGKRFREELKDFSEGFENKTECLIRCILYECWEFLVNDKKYYEESCKVAFDKSLINNILIKNKELSQSIIPLHTTGGDGTGRGYTYF